MILVWINYYIENYKIMTCRFWFFSTWMFKKANVLESIFTETFLILKLSQNWPVGASWSCLLGLLDMTPLVEHFLSFCHIRSLGSLILSLSPDLESDIPQESPFPFSGGYCIYEESFSWSLLHASPLNVWGQLFLSHTPPKTTLRLNSPDSLYCLL